MREFEKKLLRLKEAVGLTQDQQVADLLGMTKAAFFERKKRDSFPDDKVYALAARHPEYNLDVDHILTGTSDRQRELNKRLLSIKASTQKAAALGLEPPYTHAVQEILFFVELVDGAGVMNTFRHVARQVAIDDQRQPPPDSGKSKRRSKHAEKKS